MTSGDTIFVSAGEFSGDLLAAELVTELRTNFPGVNFAGVCGPALRNAGVEQLADQSTLSVMGIAEVLPRISDLKIFESDLLESIDRCKPKFAILVDSPGFHFRLAEHLKMRGIPVVQYVAPKLWAWGKGRMKRLKRDFDLVIGILPFEEKFFKDGRIPYQLSGSPHLDRVEKIRVSRDIIGIAAEDKVLGILPGSRISELSSLLGDIVTIFGKLSTEINGLVGVLPLAPNLSSDDLKKLCRKLGIKFEASNASAENPEIGTIGGGIRVFRGMSLELMAMSDAALVASGTATFECGLLGVPMAVIYRMNVLTYMIAKRVVDLPYVSLVNLMANELVSKEYIQSFSCNDVALELKELLLENKGVVQRTKLSNLKRSLKGNAAVRAASIIEKWWEQKNPA